MSQSWRTCRHPNFATLTLRPPRSEPYHARATGYELRNADGVALQWSESSAPLVRHLGDKRGCVVVRVRDGVLVASSPVGEAGAIHCERVTYLQARRAG